MNQGFATEADRPIFSGGALGAENIRHRRASAPKILMRRPPLVNLKLLLH